MPQKGIRIADNLKVVNGKNDDHRGGEGKAEGENGGGGGRRG